MSCLQSVAMQNQSNRDTQLKNAPITLNFCNWFSLISRVLTLICNLYLRRDGGGIQHFLLH